MRIGFRPFEVKVSPDPSAYPTRAILRHTFFLGVMLRLELEFPSGLTLRARMTKEEYSQLHLTDGQAVSVLIRTYRILDESEKLSPEIIASGSTVPPLGEGI